MPRPCKLTFYLLTLKVVCESHVTWATSVPILVFLSLSDLDLGPMYATERERDVRQTSDAHHRLMPPTLEAGAGIIMKNDITVINAHDVLHSVYIGIRARRWQNFKSISSSALEKGYLDFNKKVSYHKQIARQYSWSTV